MKASQCRIKMKENLKRDSSKWPFPSFWTLPMHRRHRNVGNVSAVYLIGCFIHNLLFIFTFFSAPRCASPFRPLIIWRQQWRRRTDGGVALSVHIAQPKLKVTARNMIEWIHPSQCVVASFERHASLTCANGQTDNVFVLLINFRLLIECHNKDYKPETIQRGDFWVLKNYIRADHGELRCFETITYTTHADYTFLDNLIPLLER